MQERSNLKATFNHATTMDFGISALKEIWNVSKNLCHEAIVESLRSSQ